MERPVEVEGHEVGDVDQDRDRPQPDRLQRRCSQSGEGPFLSRGNAGRPRSGRAVGLGLVAMRPLDRARVAALDLSALRARACRRPPPARSRAMPCTPRQSPRLGVTLISITGSSRPSASAAGAPVLASAGRSMMPLCRRRAAARARSRACRCCPRRGSCSP
jgi:hypothetical protein